MSQHVTDPESWIAEHLSGPQEKFARFAERVYDGDALSRKTKELTSLPAQAGRFFAFYTGCLTVLRLLRELHWTKYSIQRAKP